MALRWIVHTACNVLGYQNDTTIQCKTAVGYQAEVHAHATSGVINKRSKAVVVNESCGLSQIQAYPSGFQMPLHYPRYSKSDYEKMEEWKVDMLLGEYGLSFQGTLDEKRAYAMGAFLWPDQY